MNKKCSKLHMNAWVISSVTDFAVNYIHAPMFIFSRGVSLKAP